MIHPTALIDPDARLAEDVRVGPYAVIGAGVEIGSGCRIGAHCVIEGPTRIGRNNQVFPHSALGQAPQDKKFCDEPTRLEIGDDNTIREFCTFNRGTVQGGGVTRVGNGNWIMAYAHIAHDCLVGNHTIFANAASLAGHVEVHDHAILGGFSLVHQFCRIGAHAFTSMGSVINRDVPPYVTVAGKMAEPKGINSEGLKRRGFDGPRILAVKRAYKTLYLSGLGFDEARSRLHQAALENPDLFLFASFLDGSSRSIVR